MSKIAVVLCEPKIEVAVLGELHRLLGCSLKDLCHTATEKRPVVETEIFDNRYDEKTLLLRELISLIKRNELESEVYEFLGNESFAENQGLEPAKISIEILENILDAADQD